MQQLRRAFILLLAQTYIVFWQFTLCVCDDATVSEAFAAKEVVPDVVSKSPDALATVVYSSDAEVMLGEELPLGKVLAQPQYVSWDADANEYYTLAMVDPDVPSRALPLLREFLHWLVVNIPGSDYSSGSTVSPYMPPTPPVGTGLHRYVFLIYRQRSKEEFNETFFINRTLFSIEDFAKRYNFEGPIAGNFFQTQFAVSVSEEEVEVGPLSLAVPKLL